MLLTPKNKTQVMNSTQPIKNETTYNPFEINNDFYVSSLTGVTQAMLALNQLHFKRFESLKDRKLDKYNVGWPLYIGVDSYKYSLAICKVMVYNTGFYDFGYQFDKATPPSLMQLYMDGLLCEKPEEDPFMSIVKRLQSLCDRELGRNSVMVIPNAIEKIPRLHGDYTPIFEYMYSNKSNLLRSELEVLSNWDGGIDIIIIMGQKSSYNYIINKTLGDYTTISPGINRFNRLLIKDSDIPVLQLPNALFLTVIDRVDEALNFLKSFIFEQMRLRLLA